jgi:hypothetical protein
MLAANLAPTVVSGPVPLTNTFISSYRKRQVPYR